MAQCLQIKYIRIKEEQADIRDQSSITLSILDSSLVAYTIASEATSVKTSWVCDPSSESYALEQPEMLRSHDYNYKCMHQSSVRPLYIVDCEDKTTLQMITFQEGVNYNLVWSRDMTDH